MAPRPKNKGRRSSRQGALNPALLQRQTAQDSSGKTIPLPEVGGKGGKKAYIRKDWLSLFESLSVHHGENFPVQVLRDMHRRDETISSGIEFIMLSVIFHFGKYKNSFKPAQKWADKLWENSLSSLEKSLEEALTSLIYGRAVGEICLREGNGQIWLDELSFIRPDHYRFTADEYGRVAGVQLSGGQGSAFIPAERLLRQTNRGWFNNPYGDSRLNSVYEIWMLKHSMRKHWGLTLERYGSPIAIGKTKHPQFVETDEKTGAQKTRQELMVELLSNLAAGTSVVLPSEDEIEINQLEQALGDCFENFENHANKMILRGLLLPALLFEPTDVGSFALGKKQFEVFLSSIRHVVKDLRETFLQQLYKPLLILNFGEECPLGEFVGPDVDEDEIKVWAEIYTMLTEAGYFSPDQQTDMDTIREKVWAPKVDASKYKPKQPPAPAPPPATAEQPAPPPAKPSKKKAVPGSKP